MNVVLPNGTIIQGVPEGTTKEQVMQKAISSGLATQEDFGQQPPQGSPDAQNQQPQVAQSQDGQPAASTPVAQQQDDISKALESIGGGRSAVTDLTGMATGYAKGLGEIGLQALSGMAGTGAGVVKSTFDKLTGEGGEKAAKDLLGTQKAFTYEPRSKEGKQIGRGISEVLSPVIVPIQNKLGEAADYIDKDLNSPLAAAHVRNALNEIPYLFEAGKLARAGAIGRGAETSANEATAEREAPAQTVAPDVPADAPKQIAEAAKLSEKKQAKNPEVVASRFDPDKDRVDAAKRLGIVDELLPSTLSKNKQAIEIERGLASMPGSRLSESSKRETEAVAQKADDLISEFGGTTDKAALSDKLKSSINDSINGLYNKSEQLYSKINESIPKTSKVDTSDIKSRLNEEAENMGGAENLEPIEKHVLSISNKEGGPTYALLDKERKKIGTAMRKSKGPYKDANSGTLKQLYAMITEAQEKTASEYGMADSWNAAKGLDVKRKQLEDNSVKLLGKHLTGAIMPQVGEAVKKLTTGDYKKFDEVMSALPKSERQEVVMSSLNDAFTGGSRKEKQLSAPGFVDWMEGLKRNSAAKNRLYKNMPDGAAERLEDIYKVAKGMREAKAETITTGRSKTLIDNFDAKDGILSRLFGIGLKFGGSALTGHFFGPLAGAAAAGGSIMTEMLAKSPKIPLHEAADKMLSSPEFRKAIVDYAGATSETKRAAIEKTMAKKQVVRNWLKQMSKASLKAGTSDEAKRISKIGAINYLTQTGNQE